MLINFFVLGLIPGTHLQITFFWILILGIILDVLFGAYYCFFVLWLPRQSANYKKKPSKLVSSFRSYRLTIQLKLGQYVGRFVTKLRLLP